MDTQEVSFKKNIVKKLKRLVGSPAMSQLKQFKGIRLSMTDETINESNDVPRYKYFAYIEEIERGMKYTVEVDDNQSTFIVKEDNIEYDGYIDNLARIFEAINDTTSCKIKIED